MNQSGFYGMSVKGFEGSSNDICFLCSCVFTLTREVYLFFLGHPSIYFPQEDGSTDFSTNLGDSFHISYHPSTCTYI